MNWFLSLLIQAIEILGLELLEVLWDGVCKQKQAQGVREGPHPGMLLPGPVQAACTGRCQPAQRALQSFPTLGCVGDDCLEAQEGSFSGRKEISRQSEC